VTRAHEVVGGAIERLREALVSLHPVTLEQGGLEQALGAVARHAERRGGFEVALSCDPDALDHADELLLASARELLTNAARHSGAERVEVELRRVEGAVELEVTDDGRGIDPGSRERALAAGHIGLASLAERIGSAGGRLELADADSDAGAGARRGTRAVVRLPDDAGG
jgi:two-component system NarL family sensor kinase